MRRKTRQGQIAAAAADLKSNLSAIGPIAFEAGGSVPSGRAVCICRSSECQRAVHSRRGGSRHRGARASEPDSDSTSPGPLGAGSRRLPRAVPPAATQRQGPFEGGRGGY